MSKRKQRIALKDQRDFKKFITWLGVAVIVLIIVVYIIFTRIA
jgi:magnesium-transporting ATPase (P-type)